MRLAEPELESFLQLIVHLPCNVATKHPRDLRKPDDRLCQADVRTSEEQVPRLHGRGGAHHFTCQGHSISLKSRDQMKINRTSHSTMPTTRILPSWTSSLGIPRCLVSFHFWHNYFTICASEFERSPKMTLLDFISGFGGFCGLCLGISFVSVAEIVYWFSIRLCRRIWFDALVGCKDKKM